VIIVQWSTFAKNAKKWGVTDFVLERTFPENTVNLKNRASLANKATVSISPKLLQLDLSSEMFYAKFQVSVDLSSESSQLLRFLKEQGRI